MDIEDKVLINRIIEVLETPGDDITDGECIDQIVEILRTKYKVLEG